MVFLLARNGLQSLPIWAALLLKMQKRKSIQGHARRVYVVLHAGRSHTSKKQCSRASYAHFQGGVTVCPLVPYQDTGSGLVLIVRCEQEWTYLHPSFRY